MPLTPEQRETVKLALAGDQKAFEMLIRTYSRPIFAQAWNILRQAEEAEDVVQDTLMKAWNSKWRVRDPEKFPSWLFTIARNRAHNLLRRRRSEPLPDEAEGIEDEKAEKPGHQMEGEELREKVHGALAELPEPHRLAVTLRYMEGMDHKSIEANLGLTNGALRGILGRAM